MDQAEPDLGGSDDTARDRLPRRERQQHLEPQLRVAGGRGDGTPFSAFTTASDESGDTRGPEADRHDAGGYHAAGHEAAGHEAAGPGAAGPGAVGFDAPGHAANRDDAGRDADGTVRRTTAATRAAAFLRGAVRDGRSARG